MTGGMEPCLASSTWHCRTHLAPPCGNEGCLPAAGDHASPSDFPAAMQRHSLPQKRHKGEPGPRLQAKLAAALNRPRHPPRSPRSSLPGVASAPPLLSSPLGKGSALARILATRSPDADLAHTLSGPLPGVPASTSSTKASLAAALRAPASSPRGNRALSKALQGCRAPLSRPARSAESCDRGSVSGRERDEAEPPPQRGRERRRSDLPMQVLHMCHADLDSCQCPMSTPL